MLDPTKQGTLLRSAIVASIRAAHWSTQLTALWPQKCVELLRKQKLGVATFLILEKQQHLAAQMRQSAAPPEGEPNLTFDRDGNGGKTFMRPLPS